MWRKYDYVNVYWVYLVITDVLDLWATKLYSRESCDPRYLLALRKTRSSRSFYYLHIHFNSERPFFVDVNASKQKKFESMTFHVLFDSVGEKNVNIKRIEIQFIMFFNKQLSETEKKYWFTKLKMTDVIWMIKKIRHLIEFCKSSSMIVFIDHSVIVELVSQTFLFTFSTNKFNLRLIRVFQYLSTFFIRIKIKFERFHVISNALSRLKSTVFNDSSSILKDLNDVDVMFFKSVMQRKTSFWNIKFKRINEMLNIHFDEKIFLIEMDENFFNALKKAYETDDQWNKIRNKMKIRTNRFDIFDDIEFILKDRRIYYVSKGVISRLCILWSLKKKYTPWHMTIIIIAIFIEFMQKYQNSFT